MPRPSHSSRFYHPQNIRLGVQITKLFIMQFSPFPCYLVPLRPKYPPQHPILKHPQPTFLPQCQRPSFTPISIAFNTCIYLIQKKRRHSVHKASSHVTMDSVLTTTWYATRCQIALMTVMNHFIVMLTSAQRWRFTSVDINVWIPWQASIVNVTKATSK